MIQLCVGGFTLKENNWSAVPHYRVINLLALFGSDICDELGNNLPWIKNIVSKGIDKGHNQGVLCSFFRPYSGSHNE